MNSYLPYEPLKRLGHDPNEKWCWVWDNIEKLVTKSHIDKKLDEAAELIDKFTEGQRAAYCWSGGKDSLPLQIACERVGLFDSMYSLTNLLTDDAMQWTKKYAPKNMVYMNSGEDIHWLAKPENHGWLFMNDPTLQWSQSRVHGGQHLYADQYDKNMLLYGRRIQDRNWCGPPSPQPVPYETGKGWRFCPLRDWTHEEALAAVHYFWDAPEPPYFKWPRGFTVGTGPWHRREPILDSFDTWLDSWNEVYIMDRKVMIQAAEYNMPHAQRALETFLMMER